LGGSAGLGAFGFSAAGFEVAGVAAGFAGSTAGFDSSDLVVWGELATVALGGFGAAAVNGGIAGVGGPVRTGGMVAEGRSA